MKPKFHLSLSGLDLLDKKDATFFKRKLKLALETLGLEEKLLTVHLCDDAEIKQLNSRFRKKKKATDVLSFEVQGDLNEPFYDDVLGDVIISVDTAGRQANEAGHSLKEELVVLFVHGLLHLLGYDHEKGEEEAVRQAEAELFLLSEIEVDVEIALIGRQFSC